MNEIMTEIVAACIPIITLLITAGGAYLVALLRKQTAKLQQEVENDTACKYMDMACEAVAQAVTYTTQTFVEALKSEGAFTKEKQLEAFYIAKTKVLAILGETAVHALEEIYGDFDLWLNTKIEQVCAENKLQQKAATQPAVFLLESPAVEVQDDVTVEVEAETAAAEEQQPE